MIFPGATMFNYYIKIVPTLYVNSDGATLPTNQFSVTRHEKVWRVFVVWVLIVNRSIL
jgi:hypothetical protein